MEGTVGKAVIRTIGMRSRFAQAFAQMSPSSLAKSPSFLKSSISFANESLVVHSLYSSMFSVTSQTKKNLRFSLSRSSLGTLSNADFCYGDGDRKSNLFPVDVLHFGGKPFSLRADVKTASFPLSTKRGYIFCFHALNIYHFFLIWFP